MKPLHDFTYGPFSRFRAVKLDACSQWQVWDAEFNSDGSVAFVFECNTEKLIAHAEKWQAITDACDFTVLPANIEGAQ